MQGRQEPFVDNRQGGRRSAGSPLQGSPPERGFIFSVTPALKAHFTP